MDLFGERGRLLNQKIQKIIIGIEPIGVKAAHAITNSFIGRFVRLDIPTYLGGGSFVYHLSCLLFLSSETIILEFGAYYGDEDGYRNYIHYVYNAEKEGGLRFSRMTESDYRSKVINGKKGAFIIDHLTIDKTMTLKELIDKCKSNSSWRANDYYLSTHNCQDFIAKVIEILKAKRTFDDETKYSHRAGKINYPPVILKALEKNDTPVGLRIAEQIPFINNFVEIGAFIYKKSSKK